MEGPADIGRAFCFAITTKTNKTKLFNILNCFMFCIIIELLCFVVKFVHRL
ncbi:MAG: hypothetical protein H6Q65_1419 [Firmicutes bacterium]|nr:hypothetical protein [Bacillota bacterium]